MIMATSDYTNYSIIIYYKLLSKFCDRWLLCIFCDRAPGPISDVRLLEPDFEERPAANELATYGGGPYPSALTASGRSYVSRSPRAPRCSTLLPWAISFMNALTSSIRPRRQVVRESVVVDMGVNCREWEAEGGRGRCTGWRTRIDGRGDKQQDLRTWPPCLGSNSDLKGEDGIGDGLKWVEGLKWIPCLREAAGAAGKRSYKESGDRYDPQLHTIRVEHGEGRIVQLLRRTVR